MESRRHASNAAEVDSRRSIASKIWALLIFGISAVGSSGLFAKGDLRQWIVDVLLNLGFVSLGLIVALMIGERWIAEAERRHWSPVSSAINKRAFRAAVVSLGGFADAPTIRSELMDRGRGPIPTYNDLADNFEFAHSYLSEKLL